MEVPSILATIVADVPSLLMARDNLCQSLNLIEGSSPQEMILPVERELVIPLPSCSTQPSPDEQLQLRLEPTRKQ